MSDIDPGKILFAVIQGEEGDWEVRTTSQEYWEEKGYCDDEPEQIQSLMPKGAIQVQESWWEFHQQGKIDNPPIYQSAEAVARAMLECGFKWDKGFQEFCSHDGHYGPHPIPGLEAAIVKEETEFNKALGTVITSLLERARESARGTDSWKNLFTASEHGLESLIDDADLQTGSIIHNLIDVIQQKFGIKHCSTKLYDLLSALPFSMRKLRDKIKAEQGLSCSSDKARHVYYEEVLEEINRIRAEEGS